MKNKILIIGLAITSIVLFLVLINIWTISIVDIEADNFESKLHRNNGSVWQLGIEDYMPTVDSRAFSVRTRETFTYGDNIGVRIVERPDYESKYNALWYEFESEPSTLQYRASFLKRESPLVDKVVEIQIHSDFNEYNIIRIRQIIDDLIEDNGFVLKKSNQIKGNDIIIKETEEGFIVGRIDFKYDHPEGIYFSSFSKKIIF